MAQRGQRSNKSEDDFRSLVQEDNETTSATDFDFDEIETQVIDDNSRSSGGRRRGLGLSPMERAFLAVMLFLNVAIMGAGVLVVTGRLVLPF
jgi:hypothetical protein